MKNNNEKINHDPRLKNLVSMSFRLFIFIVCFMFLSFRLATSVTGIAYANSAPDDCRKSSTSSVITSIDPNNVKALELLRADMSVAFSQNDTKSKNQLKKVIEQIRSVEFEPQKQVSEPVIVPEQPTAIEPKETVPVVPVQKIQAEQAEPKVEPKPQHEPITKDTLQVLRSLATNPEKLTDPFELAEILFFSGNFKEALMFYSETLKRLDPNDIKLSGDRAWVLFQIGNCLRKDDMPAAAKMYRQLLTEYPNSPWTDLATVRNNLIAWYLKDEPFTLLKEVNRSGNGKDNIR